MFYRRLSDFPTLSLRSSFDELDRMRRQMERIFDDLTGSSFFMGTRAGVFPFTNLTEDRDNYYVRAELPGVRSEDLDIQATGNSISISGERKIEGEEENVKYHRQEREAGRFSRVIGLPGEIDPSRVTASLVNGILKITLPKAEAAKPKQITVK